MKKIFGLAMMLVALFTLKATAQQMPQPQQLPLDPAVKHGVLPNGLTYYILHNAEPKNRANFYIAQKVGSTLETPQQLGLAHFLEHMAFNGTKTYPGKNLLNYLQTKGIRFGQDINAYTMFDETVYNINNVPTNDVPLMDSVLLALRDWSGSILLETAEIDAERGVIREEWRQRDDARTRQFTTILPKLFQEYQYQQMPIGSMDVVMNFKPKALRDYYKKWYRPDQQGIVVVGDFDADVMEKKVVELFSKIKMPKNAAERKYASVSDNEAPIYVSFEDPEFPSYQIRLSFKKDAIPDQLKNTDMGVVMNDLVPGMVCSMLNERLSDASQSADSPFAYAFCMYGNYYVAKTKAAFDIIIVPKEDVEAGYLAALKIVAQACKTGFTQGEIERARDKVLATLDAAYNRKDKTNNDDRAKEFIENFVNGQPAPGIELERMMKQQYLQVFPVEVYNQFAASLITPTNRVISVAAPTGSKILTQESSIGLLDQAMNAQYEAYVDEVITEPLLSQLPAQGTIVKEYDNAEFGTHVFELSNGVKVVLKTTDFEPDKINVQIFAEGGKRSFPESESANVLLMGDAYQLSKLGPFDYKTLNKYVAGKKVSLGFEIGSFTNYFQGNSAVKDFPTLMEVIYASFTAVSPDKATYDSQVAQTCAILKNYESNPDFIFKQHTEGARFGNNPMMMQPTVKLIQEANYEKMMADYHKLTSNAADFTFTFVGNITADALRPYLTQYIASLPAGEKTPVKEVTNVAIQSGQIVDDYNQQMQKESVNVYNCFSGTNVDFNIDNVVKMEFISDILDMIYTETLREEEGGTYGAATNSFYTPNTGQWAVLYMFGTNPQQADALSKRAYDEFMDLLQNGAKEDFFNKVKEAAIKQLDIMEHNNDYWLNGLLSAERGYNTLSGRRQAVESLTLADLNAFMKNLYDGKNRIQVVMNGGPDK